MSWERTHRRYDLVRTVLDEVRRHGPDLPPALLTEIDDVFGSFPAFLADVRRRWYQSFDARLDALLEHPPRNSTRPCATCDAPSNESTRRWRPS